MDHKNGSYNTGSKIPRFSGQRPSPGTNGFHPDPLPNIGQKPSRLEQMQAEYQRNLLKEKEEKMISLYEENQQKALQRVTQKKGSVREFFNERRAQGSGDNAMAPTIEKQFQQKKSDSQISGHENGFGNRQSPKYTNYNKGNLKGVPKQSAGRDRSNLLAPIQRNKVQDSDNPFAKCKPQIVRPRTMGKLPNSENSRANLPMSAPTGDNFHNLANNANGLDEDGSPLPNPQQLLYLQQKRKMLQSQHSSTRSMHVRKNGSHSNRQNGIHRNTPESSRKAPSSLNTYDYEPSDEDEGFGDNNSHSADDEIKKKQQELLAQIEAQQRELVRLRNERKQAEMEEVKETERRRRIEEERRKKQAEEDRKRQKEEEEERMRQQWEEEKLLKQEAEKRRMHKTSHTSNGDSGYMYDEDDYKENTPTPPPQRRPPNTRKTVPKKRSQPKLAVPSPPTPKGDHVSLYENAAFDDGAFENVGRLVSCHNCGRKFAEDRLEKHEKFCRNATKKRKVMDPSKTRTRGTELEQYQAHKTATPPAAKKNNWRSKHQSFIEAIRYAKKCSEIEKKGGNLADLPPPPPSENPDYVQCPHCTRKFNEKAAERHIPHCKNSRAKPPPRRR